MELLDDAIGFTARALMSLNGREQITGSAIMQKIDALTDSPQGRRAKFIRPRGPLSQTVGQSLPHVMHEQIGVKIGNFAG